MDSGNIDRRRLALAVGLVLKHCMSEPNYDNFINNNDSNKMFKMYLRYLFLDYHQVFNFASKISIFIPVHRE